MSTTDVPAIITDALTIGSTTVSNISSDPTNGGATTLITGAALAQSTANMQSLITSSIQNYLTGSGGEIVVTQNLMSPSFVNTTTDPQTGWSITNWTISGNIASISNTSLFTSNGLFIPIGRYPAAKYYLISFTVLQITGTLQLVLNNQILTSITAPGSYRYLINITNAISDTVSLTAIGVSIGNTISITTPALCGISNSLYEFTNALFVQLNTTNVSSPSITNSVAFATNQILASPPAYVPAEIVGSDMLSLPTTLKVQSLLHTGFGNYDITSGYITSTVDEYSGNLINVVTNDSTTNFPVAGGATFSINPTGATQLVITYRFVKPRMVSSVILYTQPIAGTPSIYSVTGISVTVGTVTNSTTMAIPADTVIGTATVNFSATMSDSVIITITGYGIQTNAVNLFSFGFGVSFSDIGSVPTSQVAISGDTKVSMMYNNSNIALAVNSDLSLDTSNIATWHTYYAAVTTIDGITSAAELISIPPNLDNITKPYVYDLVNMTNSTDAYYGTVTTTGLVDTGNGIYLNSPYYAKIPTTYMPATSNVVTTTHTFLSGMIIDHILVLLPNKLISGYAYPTAATLSLVTTTGTHTLNLPIDLSTVVGADITTATGGSTMVVTLGIPIDSGNLLSYGGITSYTLTLSTAQTGVLLAVNSINVGLQCLTYDRINNVWSDGMARTIVGSINAISPNQYQICPYPVGSECIIPINGMLITQFYSLFGEINPFLSNDIEVSVYSVLSTLADTRQQTHGNTAITPSYIQHLLYESSIYFARIRRI